MPYYAPNHWNGYNGQFPAAAGGGSIHALSSGLGQVASTIELLNNFISLSMMTSRNIYEHYQHLKANLVGLLRFLLDTLRSVGKGMQRRLPMGKMAIFVLAVIGWLSISAGSLDRIAELGGSPMIKGMVVFNVESDHPEVLQVKAGELVMMQPIPKNTEWLQGQTMDGLQTGLIPATHVKISPM